MSYTPLSWAPRIPEMGIYPTVESMLAQGVLVFLFLVALIWTFLIEPRRIKVTSELVPEPARSRAENRSLIEGIQVDRDVLRSLERMDADLAELRAEVERLKQKLTMPRSGSGYKR